MLARIVLLLCFVEAVGYACDCIAAPAREAKRDADIVFRGTVARFRHTDAGETMVVFKVSRVWKGRVTGEFEMPASQGDSCLSFPRKMMTPGSELLVYARKLDRPEYYPMA